MPPSRYVNLPEARVLYGHRVDRLAPFFDRADPLADEAVAEMASANKSQRERWIDAAFAGETQDVPRALTLLTEAVKSHPVWFEPARSARGGEVILRSGLWGGLSLAYKSMLTAYCSPAGVKPLAFSGRLTEDVARRIGETGRFVETVSAQGALEPDSEAVKVTLRVRLMHAQVRYLILLSGKWNADAWGVPINQVDMAGTALLFSSVLLEGLEQFGVAVSAPEREDVMHLWRTVGWKLGVHDELLALDFEQGRKLLDLILFTQEPPDEDCRALTAALLEGPNELQRTMNRALARRLLGDVRADALGIPATAVQYGLPALQQAVRWADRAVVATGWGRRASLKWGESYWKRAVEQTLGRKGAVMFGLPTSLSPARVGHEAR
jgi:hypothetical protein